MREQFTWWCGVAGRGVRQASHGASMHLYVDILKALIQFSGESEAKFEILKIMIPDLMFQLDGCPLQCS